MADDLQELVNTLPKAELHVHLEGSTPAWLAGRWAQREGVRIEGLDQDAKGQWRYTFRGFAAFLDCYIALSHCITQPQDIEQLAGAVAHELAAQQVRYVEMTFTPTTHLARSWERATLIEALQSATLAAAERGVQMAWVFDFVRCYPDTGAPTVDFAIAAREAGLRIAGVGVGGPEGDEWPSSRIAATFRAAKDAGFASLPHAGENRGAQGVKEAIEMLGATRIGHGIRAVEDPQVMALLEREEICLEICPTSNLQLLGIASLHDHPLAKIQHSKIRWTLASDDPPLVGTTLNQEYLRCAQAYGWGAKTLCDIAEQSFASALLAPAQKAQWIADVQRAYQTWQAL